MREKNSIGFKPTVAVVIPTYNREAHIENAIRSVQNQTYPPHEIIVSDDGSTDSTETIVRNMNDHRILFISSSGNRGAQAARNAGIKAASSEWIAFLDSDDEWLPNRLTDAFDVARNRSVGVVYSNYYQRRFLDGGVSDLLMNPEIHEGNVLKPILRKSFVSFPGLTVRRDHLFEIGLLDESIRSWQEWDTCIRLAEKFEFAYSPHPSFIWNWHSGETISKDVLRDAMGIIQIVLKHYQLFLSVAGKDVLYLHFSAALNKLQQVDGENVELLRVKIRTALMQLGNNS
ncbi:UDP-Glc:alpha-D-GlcNAc-diphosphoundecaprenol beta-1,3-glucosyltransferase WfgD [uncultured bacterium]|nr:UDP-Glc:alpha-D-GlcNAc-diphosphoundecaprenol beta-1,3-glucosyltransferase WfgD [uncultured bacterium]